MDTLRNRVRIDKHLGKDVLRTDYSHLKTAEEIYAVIEHSWNALSKRPPQSLLSLIDVTEIFFDTEIVTRLRDAAKKNEPYIRATAIVGVTGLKRVFIPVIAAFSKREFKLFDTTEEALKYLVAL